MHRWILVFLFFLAAILHLVFVDINSILKVADSFAYLQMSEFLQMGDIRGFGTGWFGFLYSAFLAIFDGWWSTGFDQARVFSNLLLLLISGGLLYHLASYYLDQAYVYLVLILFFFSASWLHYHVHVLSENIYLPLFLLLCLVMHLWWSGPLLRTTIGLAAIIVLLYLTRAEAFIYLAALGLMMMIATMQKRISYQQFFGHVLTLGVAFLIFASPYIYFLSTHTGELGLTNKGASNLRQAELRGIEHMDDSGFERAVAELTEDKKHLIAGFAGGMEYDRPRIEGSIVSYVLDDPESFFLRVLENQKKLYTHILPKILFGPALKLYYSQYAEMDRFGGLLLAILFPLLFIIFGLYKMFALAWSRIRDDRSFIWLFTPLYLIASIFFTLFFVLERYFIVFLPLMLILMCYGIQYLLSGSSVKLRKLLYGILLIYLSLHSLFGVYGYYEDQKGHDDRYRIKQVAGIWVHDNVSCMDLQCSFGDITPAYKTFSPTYNSVKILERFPIVTYYSGSLSRYITPYTNELSDIIIYAKHHGIHLLVVDSLDFARYRPGLDYLLDESVQHEGLELVGVWNQYGEKLILYKIVY